MRKYKKYVTNYVWDRFVSLQNDPSNFKDFVSYFAALASWVKCNRKFIQRDWLYSHGIYTLLNIDAKRYVSDCPDVLLSNEPKRMFQCRSKRMSELLSRISHTMWDLVKKPTGKICPICKDGGLNYVVADIIETKGKKIILQCEICTWEENLDGTRYSDGPADIYPASKDDLSGNSV